MEVDSHTPSIYNFTFGLQQDIGFQTVMEVSYVGSFARHLGQRININGVPDGARLGTNNIDPVTGQRIGNDFLRPFRGYADINMVTWGGTSNYNSLQVQVGRRYTQGFQYGLAYTYSKSFDYANDDSSDVTFGRPYKQFNYAPSDFDQTHILTVNYIYDVPDLSRKLNNGFVKAIFDNWQLSGTTSYASGKPKNITVTYNGGITDITGGEINARANTICDPMRNISGADPTGNAVRSQRQLLSPADASRRYRQHAAKLAAHAVDLQQRRGALQEHSDWVRLARCNCVGRFTTSSITQTSETSMRVWCLTSTVARPTRASALQPRRARRV